MRIRPILVIGTLVVCAFGADQTKTGAGNDRAASMAGDSAMVQSAMQFLTRQMNQIQDGNLRTQTLDAVRNRNTCVSSRTGVTDVQKNAMIQKLTDQGLVDPADESRIPQGGIKAGIFPPLRDENTDCPKLPQPFSSAPGGATYGHHSYPGGLPIHESFNEISSLNLARGYRAVYGMSRVDGMPVIAPDDVEVLGSDIFLSQDVTVAAPIWHDWAKPIVFQWNDDGTEFTELNFGGNGRTDAWGAAGDSKTGAHHIIGIAEAMKRGLPPDFVIAQASAHSNPTSGSEYKVVNWLRAAAILAQIDPVAGGYLMTDSKGQMRLPALRWLGSVDLLTGGSVAHTNVLAEYVLHNLSDADFTLTGPAVTEVQSVLAAVAPQYGYKDSDVANYNNKFRNMVLSNLSAERLLILYANGGTDAVVAEINKIRAKVGGSAAAVPAKRPATVAAR